MHLENVLFLETRPLSRYIPVVMELLLKMLHDEVFEVDAFHFDEVSQLLLSIIMSLFVQSFYLKLS